MCRLGPTHHSIALCTFTFCKWEHTCHMDVDVVHAHRTQVSVHLASLCCLRASQYTSCENSLQLSLKVKTQSQSFQRCFLKFVEFLLRTGSWKSPFLTSDCAQLMCGSLSCCVPSLGLLSNVFTMCTLVFRSCTQQYTLLYAAGLPIWDPKILNSGFST